MRTAFIFRTVGGVTLAALFLGLTGCHSTQYERSTGEFVDDQMLERRVQNALSQQPVYKFPDVHVHTFRGVVQLSGFVASDAQKEAAAEIARRVRGVGEVENSITLAPLAEDNLRTFIPGRETGTAVGRPGSERETTSGSETNNVRVRTSGSETNGIDVRVNER